MELTIIIPTVGKMGVLKRTLDAVLAATESAGAEIILVDDSTDGVVKTDNSKIQVIRSFGKGASNARNEGLKHAKGELLLFLDDDILISEKHVLKTLQLHKESKKRAYNFYWVYPDDLMDKLPQTKFGKYVLHEGLYSNQHRLSGDYESLSLESMQYGLTSQYFSIEKKWMNEVGGYESIPYAGIEDLLLYKKLKAIGVEVVLCKDQIVFQNEAERIHIDQLFNRYRTGALTRRIASLRGHKNMGVQFNGIEKLKGELGIILLPTLRAFERRMNYGLLYRKVIHYILFTGTYLGYYKDNLPPPYAKEFNN